MEQQLRKLAEGFRNFTIFEDKLMLANDIQFNVSDIKRYKFEKGKKWKNEIKRVNPKMRDCLILETNTDIIKLFRSGYQTVEAKVHK